ncbi:gas vesicle protein K [Anaerobacillus sp. MEB173]|uniref:gas vesicle protein K n=1 Tax=Anaerobacillus sp. MEB173 TaxID=3383345 RepID=UPI003F92C67E
MFDTPHYPNEKLNFNSENIEHGLAKLVLTVIELLRQLVERQALRRVEGGTLSDQEIEELGFTLMKLEEKMEEIKSAFNLEGEDLNIDLGPLGNLL